MALKGGLPLSVLDQTSSMILRGTPQRLARSDEEHEARTAECDTIAIVALNQSGILPAQAVRLSLGLEGPSRIDRGL